MKREHWEVLRLLWSEQKRHWPWAAAAAALLFASAALQLPAPLVTRYLVDVIIPSGQLSQLHLLAGALLGVVAVYHGFSYLFHRVSVENRLRVEGGLRQRLWEKLLLAPVSLVEGEAKGYLEARLDADVDRVGDLFLDTLLEAALQVTTLLVGVGLLFHLNPFMAGVSLAAVPLYLWSSRHFLPQLEAASGVRQEAWARFRGQLVELLALFGVVKAHGGEAVAQRRYGQALQGALAADRAFGLLSAKASAVAALGGALLPLFVLWYGAWAIMAGRWTLGAFLAFHGALAYLYGPVRSLVGMSFDLAAALAAGRRLLEVLGWEQEIQGGKGCPVPERFLLEVRELRVSPGGGREVGPVSFSLAPGQWVALVGETGVGKSTVLRALVGMAQVSSGSLTLAGRSLAAYPLRELRRRVLLVHQEPRFFADTIAANLRAFAPTATDQELAQALWFAVLEEAVARQPQGLDTPLVEGGASLSGGERQRLALARALLLRPAVLLLDEITAGLDEATEKKLLARLRQLPFRPAVLWVTHRHAPLSAVEHVITLEPAPQSCLPRRRR